MNFISTSSLRVDNKNQYQNTFQMDCVILNHQGTISLFIFVTDVATYQPSRPTMVQKDQKYQFLGKIGRLLAKNHNYDSN